MSQPFSSIDANVASEVQPLHQGLLSNLELQRQILAKKIAENDGKFASPTDDLMSPCTAKLQANKKRQYMKAKPLSLQSRFAQVQMQASRVNKEN